MKNYGAVILIDIVNDLKGFIINKTKLLYLPCCVVVCPYRDWLVKFKLKEPHTHCMS